MTQVEEILTALEESGGLTSVQLREQLDIKPNVLATLLWEMKRDGLIARIGGHRGSYVYGVTQKGRNQLSHRDVDSLTQLAEALGGGAATAQHSAFPELMLLVGQIEDYKLLRRYNEWIATEKTSPVHPLGEEVREELDREAMRFLGVNPDEYQRQRDSLNALLKLV